MAVTPKAIIDAQQVASSSTLYYTSTNVVTIIDKFTATNTTAGAVTITVYVGTASASHTIISGRSVGAGECYICPEMVGQVLNAGDTIYAVASAATSITIRASGRQVTGA
jgi:hypothetical protein